MTRFMSRFLWVGSLMLLGGCITRENTRLPTLGFGDPQAEKRSYEFHDPLPLTEPGGSSDGARPRGFDVGRTEPRRAIEQSANPVPFGSDGTTNSIPPPSRRYQKSVAP